MAWEPDIPIHLQNFHHLPAMNNWFTSNAEEVQVSFRDKLKSHANALVSYELMTTSSHKESPSRCPSKCLEEFYTWLKTQTPKDDSHLIHEIVGHVIESAKNNQSRFQQFESPLSLLIWACHFNKTRDNSLDRIRQLYIAQSDIRSLPIPIVEDLPVPKIVMQAGRGDIYSSSIWLGLQPTYTPLHRDPNPNLFCQLVGVKAVRLMQPKAGLSVFQEVRRKLRSPGNSRFRGPEMMDGPERDGLHHAIWVEPNASKSMWQAILSPGDALFIPQGWWHTVISLGDEAELNASANWWFR
ncbi:Clavaminate synthase-like protein [Xylariaceae sp. FL1651]|nr:Clavaminate synthase-like protein [Xylariaceae sp. FL1651]